MKHFMGDISVDKIVTKVAARETFHSGMGHLSTAYLASKHVVYVYTSYWLSCYDNDGNHFGFNIEFRLPVNDQPILMTAFRDDPFSNIKDRGRAVLKWLIPDSFGSNVGQEHLILERLQARTPKAQKIVAEMAKDLASADPDELPPPEVANTFLRSPAGTTSTWLRAATDLQAGTVDPHAKIKDVKEDFEQSLDEAFHG
jgi:hypothetical protein